jgi:hypothetical protein
MTEVTSFEQDMAQFHDDWAEAQETERTGGVLEDGDYQVRITESRVEKSDWQEWQWALRYEDLASPGFIHSWDSLEHEVGRRIGAERAKQLGYEGPIEGLGKACEDGQFIDLVCDIRVKTKKGENRDFRSVYINRVHGKVVDGTETFDDVPF